MKKKNIYEALIFIHALLNLWIKDFVRKDRTESQKREVERELNQEKERERGGGGGGLRERKRKRDRETETYKLSFICNPLEKIRQ